MLENKGIDDPQRDAADTLTPVSDPVRPDQAAEPGQKDDASFDESLTDELAALIDDGRTYAKAELAFQKARARLAGRSVGMALALAIVAIILLHIAFLALAVGMVMALAPLVTIWGAIAVVVGGLLLGVGLLVYGAIGHGKLLAELFSDSDEDESK